jgi:hypothetical protein
VFVLDGVEMLDVRETAGLARRTPETVRRWIWAGRLNARRHGGKLLVARRDVEDLVGGGSPATPLTLAEWAETVDRQRRAGELGDAGTAATAADLVLDDRSRRQAG